MKITYFGHESSYITDEEYNVIFFSIDRPTARDPPTQISQELESHRL